jgi:flagellar basal body-associated protein FliL
MAPPVSSKKRSSALPIVLVLLVLALGAAAVAAWRLHLASESTPSDAPSPG